MTSISKSPVRWRGEGRALALKERGSPSEAFRKPVITDPTYIKRCRQPPATSRRGLCLPSPFLPFSLLHRFPRLPSAFTCGRPVRASFFLPNLFILVRYTFARSLFRFLFSFVFSFVLSVHFERPPASTPTAVHLIWPFPPIRVQRTLRFLFYFTLLLYLLTHSRFLSASPPFLHRLFLFIRLSSLPFSYFSSFSHLRLLCRQSRGSLLGIIRKTEYSRKERTNGEGEREKRRWATFLVSSFLVSLLSLFHFPPRPRFFFLPAVPSPLISLQGSCTEIPRIFSGPLWYLAMPSATFRRSVGNVGTNAILKM